MKPDGQDCSKMTSANMIKTKFLLNEFERLANENIHPAS